MQVTRDGGAVALYRVQRHRFAAGVDVVFVFGHAVFRFFFEVCAGIPARVDVDRGRGAFGHNDALVFRVVRVTLRQRCRGYGRGQVKAGVVKCAAGAHGLIAVGVIHIRGIHHAVHGAGDGGDCVRSAAAVGIRADAGFAADIAEAVVFECFGGTDAADAGHAVEVVIAKRFGVVVTWDEAAARVEVRGARVVRVVAVLHRAFGASGVDVREQVGDRVIRAPRVGAVAQGFVGDAALGVDAICLPVHRIARDSAAIGRRLTAHTS